MTIRTRPVTTEYENGYDAIDWGKKATALDAPTAETERLGGYDVDTRDPKVGDVYRHRSGWTCEVLFVGYLPCLFNANESEWGCQYLSDVHGGGQLGVAAFLREFERVEG